MSKPIASLKLSHGYSVDKPVVLFTMIGGAGNQVTGSCTLISIIYKGNVTYGLIDCGIAQGRDEVRNSTFPIKPENLDFVIVTHAHADHSGALPLLRGYNGKVYATEGTLDAARILLIDEANINLKRAAREFGLSDESYKNMLDELTEMRKRSDSGNSEFYQTLLTEAEEIENSALFNHYDVDEIVSRFRSVRPYCHVKLADDIYFRLIPSTHINFSTSVELYIGDFYENSVNISFSGDIGPGDSVFYKRRVYSPNPMINYCVMESLHGLEMPEQSELEAYELLIKNRRKYAKQGRPLMEFGFALDRDAKAIYATNLMAKEGSIDFPIYFDSPLAYKELMVYEKSYATTSDLWFNDLGEAPFSTNNVIFAGSPRRRKEALEYDEGKVVILAGAFGGGGRGIDYLKKYVQNPKAVFEFLGWIDPESPTGKLLNAKKGEIVEIDGDRFIKHCETIQISGFSSHGYMPDFKYYLDSFPMLKGVILNHADKNVKEELAKELSKDYPVSFVIPEMYDANEHSFYKLTQDEISEVTSFDAYEVLNPVLVPMHISNAD